MLRILINTIKLHMEQAAAQSRLNAIIHSKKRDYIKLRLPKKYVSIIEVIAQYGIEDGGQLLEILQSHIRNKNKQPK